jgi:menaquinone-specific isochorismate synthase
MEIIRELEKFDRGFYAGPIGYLSSDESEFAVGIRSGLVHGSTLTLYSGAGIVRGSDAEAEWNEIEQKTAGFFEVLNTK